MCVRAPGCVDSENLAYSPRGRRVGSTATPPLESSFKGNSTGVRAVVGGGGYAADGGVTIDRVPTNVVVVVP